VFAHSAQIHALSAQEAEQNELHAKLLCLMRKWQRILRNFQP
jgi:hypothetical protein